MERLVEVVEEIHQGVGLLKVQRGRLKQERSSSEEKYC